MTLYQKAARRHAVPSVAPMAGMPLVKQTANLGRRLEWRRGRSTVDAAMPESLRKEHVRRDHAIFVEWQEKLDGAHYRQQVKIEGPIPHMEVHQPDTQYGDRGGKRQVARNLMRDSSDTGKEDYIIHCLFDVPEAIVEMPTDLAVELFGKGRTDIRPLRAGDWNNEGAKWSPK